MFYLGVLGIYVSDETQKKKLVGNGNQSVNFKAEGFYVRSVVNLLGYAAEGRGGRTSYHPLHIIDHVIENRAVQDAYVC